MQHLKYLIAIKRHYNIKLRY